MPIFDTYRKRKMLAARSAADPYEYDFIPEALRVQVALIWREALGVYRHIGPYNFSGEGEPKANARWRVIHRVLTKERGVFALTNRATSNPTEQCVDLLMTGSVDDALEVIEVTFRFIDIAMRDVGEWERRQEGLQSDAEEAIAELNGRFREHRLGYRFESGVIVRIDSEFLHDEATVPAIALCVNTASRVRSRSS